MLGEAGYTLKKVGLESSQHEYQYYITQSYISVTRIPNKKYLKTTKKNVFELTVLEDLSLSCQEDMIEYTELEVYGESSIYIMGDHAAERSRR